MDRTELKRSITDSVREAVNRANVLLAESGLSAIALPPVGFKLRGRTAGRTWRRGLLEFNLDIAAVNPDFIKTVIHEVAHWITYTHGRGGDCGHGKMWRHWCLALGGTGKRLHNYVNPTMYQYGCPCGVHFNITRTMHRRIVAGERRHCKKCNKDIFFVSEPRPLDR